MTGPDPRLIVNAGRHKALYDATLRAADGLERMRKRYPQGNTILAQLMVPIGEYPDTEDLVYELQLIAALLPDGVRFVDQSDPSEVALTHRATAAGPGQLSFWLVCPKTGPIATAPTAAP
jgi:hypothetical protein